MTDHLHTSCTAENAEITEMNKSIDEVTELIIGTAISVHKELGPGLLESAYETCLVYELTLKGLKVEQQKTLPITYHDIQLECGYRIDMLVEDQVVVELKAVQKLEPIHEA